MSCKLSVLVSHSPFHLLSFTVLKEIGLKILEPLPWLMLWEWTRAWKYWSNYPIQTNIDYLHSKCILIEAIPLLHMFIPKKPTNYSRNILYSFRYLLFWYYSQIISSSLLAVIWMFNMDLAKSYSCPTAVSKLMIWLPLKPKLLPEHCNTTSHWRNWSELWTECLAIGCLGWTLCTCIRIGCGMLFLPCILPPILLHNIDIGL